MRQREIQDMAKKQAEGKTEGSGDFVTRTKHIKPGATIKAGAKPKKK
jgi:hypothetical protein